MTHRIHFRYRQGERYKQKTLFVDSKDVCSCWYEEIGQGIMSIEKVVGICKKWIEENGGGTLIGID